MQYFPITDKDQKEMMEAIGISSMEALFNVIPGEYRLKNLLNLPDALSELELSQHIEKIASLNLNESTSTSFIGEISYRHYIPAIVRSLAFLPQFYTAYTPYQPEVSQGTLQSIYVFQSLMTNLTGMDLTNASMYDGASAAAEAMIMICQHKKKSKVLMSSLIHPAVSSVLKAYALNKDIEIITISSDEGSLSLQELKEYAKDDVALVIFQTPNVFGIIEDVQPIAEIASLQNIALCAVILEPLSLGILKPPGLYGVDVTVGEAQSFGIPASCGGPGVGFFSCKKEYIRKIPGRIVGKTTDDEGRTAFVMTLRAREQDIRREKATSNICTNHALCALQATIYLSALGEQGLRILAEQNILKSHIAMEALQDVPGITIPYKKPFFNEFLVQLSKPTDYVRKALQDKNILVSNSMLQSFYPYLHNPLIINLTELNTQQDIDMLTQTMKEVLS